MKNVLIINGHPDKLSFNYALSGAYKSGTKNTNSRVEEINIADLKFDPNLKFGFRERMELEPDLLQAIDKIKRADHIVWFFPIWWQGSPALMKGFIDRTFLSGITFEMIKGKPLPKKLLKGKTARMVVTSDTPRWYNYLILRNPAINQLKKGTLQFCGIRPTKITYISPIKDSTPEYREKWIKKVFLLGEKLS